MTKPIVQYDFVRVVAPPAGCAAPLGAVGTVVEIYENGDYLVDFSTDENDGLCLEDLIPTQVERIPHQAECVDTGPVSGSLRARNTRTQPFPTAVRFDPQMKPPASHTV